MALDHQKAVVGEYKMWQEILRQLVQNQGAQVQQPQPQQGNDAASFMNMVNSQLQQNQPMYQQLAQPQQSDIMQMAQNANAQGQQFLQQNTMPPMQQQQPQQQKGLIGGLVGSILNGYGQQAGQNAASGSGSSSGAGIIGSIIAALL
jgi:hypothetical protein